MQQRRHFLIAISASLVLGACKPAPPKQEFTMSNPIPFKLGESGEVFMRGMPESVASVDKQPAGANFYELHWAGRTPDDFGAMRFVHGEHSFVLENVMGFMGSEASAAPEGMNEYDLNFTVTRQETETHASARDGIYAFMKKLQASGWQKFIRPPLPRIKGMHSLSYRFHSGPLLPLDPNYVPTMNEWINGAGRFPLGSTEPDIWTLWANGVYMTIGFSRGHPKFGQSGQPTEHEPAAYLFSMNLKSETAEMRSHKLGDGVDDWKTLWSAKYAQFTKTRSETEAQMMKTDTPAKHWNWDREYKDPPILALQKPTLTITGNQVCPKSGWWTASTSNSKHWKPDVIAKMPPHRVEKGQSMPSLGTPSDTAEQRAAGNASIVWTWQKE